MPKEKKRKMKKAVPEKDLPKGMDVEQKRAGSGIPYLETNIDRLYETVKKKKSMSFLEAANEFGVDRERIASWARILEDHKLARVHYPVFGMPVIFSIEERGRTKEGEEETEAKREKRPGKIVPKIAVALAGGLLILVGYVMLVNNAFTITMRSQLTALVQRFGTLFWFLPYPLNIITPVIIIIAVLFAALRLRKTRKPAGERPVKEKSEKEKPKKEKKGKSEDIGDKLSKIKEELGS